MKWKHDTVDWIHVTKRERFARWVRVTVCGWFGHRPHRKLHEPILVTEWQRAECRCGKRVGVIVE